MRYLFKKIQKSEKNFYINDISECFSIINPSDKVKLIGVGFANTLLGVLDILAVLLFGLIGSLTVSNLSSSKLGGTTLSVIKLLGLENSTLQIQVTVLGLIVSFLLIGKSYASLVISKKIVSFLSHKSAETSIKLLEFNFAQDLSVARRGTNQKIIYSLTHGVQTIIVNIAGGLIFLIGDLFLLVFFAIGLLAVDFSVAVTAVVLFLSVGVFLGRRVNRVSAKLGEDSTSFGIESNQLLEQMIFCYRELVVRDKQRILASNIGKLRFGIAYANARLAFLGNFSKYVLEITLVMGGLTVAALQFSLNSASRAVAVISIFLMASTRIIPAVLRAQTGVAQIRASLGNAKPTLELIKSLNESTKETKLRETPTLGGNKINNSDFSPKIEITDLTFRHMDNPKNLINNLHLSVGEGEFVAITGPSGSGKTTLLDLMLGINSPSKGKVTISGLPPRQTFIQWPGYVAYVPQEVFIFDGTIKENVCLDFGKSEIPDAKVEDLLVSLGLELLIRDKGGINGQVGDRGFMLSGGQRQRIGIARALVSDPKVILFDEATSSLDSESEKLVSSYLDGMKDKITLVVVAHRLSTIKKANRILYMKNGFIELEGTWEQLCNSHPNLFT